MRFAATAIDRRAARILCVEPDSNGSRVLMKLVGAAGHSTHAVASVGEALDVIRRESVDVVVTRSPVPRQHGIELTRLMRAEGITTPVLVLAGESDGRNGLQVSEEVAGQYTVNPVDFAAVDHAIRVVVAGGRQSAMDHALHASGRAQPSSAWSTDRVLITLDTLNVADAERRLISEALARCNYNRTAAAVLLGMHVRTLRRKLKSMRQLAGDPISDVSPQGPA